MILGGSVRRKNQEIDFPAPSGRKPRLWVSRQSEAGFGRKRKRRAALRWRSCAYVILKIRRNRRDGRCGKRTRPRPTLVRAGRRVVRVKKGKRTGRHLGGALCPLKSENATLLMAVVSLYGNDLAINKPRHVTTTGKRSPIPAVRPHFLYGMFHPARRRPGPHTIPAVPKICIALDDVPEHCLRSG